MMMNFNIDLTSSMVDDVPIYLEDEFNYILYVDGGCHNHGTWKGYGAYASVLVDKAEKVLMQHSHRQLGTTNNQMEIMAFYTGVVNSVSMLPDEKKLLVVSDSKYVLDIWDKHLKSWGGSFIGKANQTLLGKLQELKTSLGEKSYVVQTKWVKGHSGHKWNEYVDNLCTQQINLLKAVHPIHKVDAN